jgi:hypothetical protein
LAVANRTIVDAAMDDADELDLDVFKKLATSEATPLLIQCNTGLL